MRRLLVRWVLKRLFSILTHVHAEGLEHIPRQGGFLLAVNHLSRLDAPLVFVTVDRDDLTALIARKYRRNPFFRWLVDAVNGIWLDRENPDAQALRTAWNYLRKGGSIGIAPEGTRSRENHALLPGKPGVAYLATKAGVPILPVGIWGTETAIAQLLRLRRPHLYIRFGEPFTLPPLRRKHRDEDLQRNTDEIMCRIAALLPPTYRGVYADHPLLRNLKAQTARNSV